MSPSSRGLLLRQGEETHLVLWDGIADLAFPTPYSTSIEEVSGLRLALGFAGTTAQRSFRDALAALPGSPLHSPPRGDGSPTPPGQREVPPTGSVGARSPLPPATPTVVITLLAGPFGTVPAAVQTLQASRRGVDTNQYWTAFGIAFVLVLGAYAVLLTSLLAA